MLTGHCCLGHKPTELAHSFFFYSVLVSVSVFMALSTVFHSCGGDVTVYVLDINQPSLPTPFFFFYSVLVSVSVFMTLSTVFHSLNSPNHSPLSHSLLLVLFCLLGPFNYVSLYKSLPQP